MHSQETDAATRLRDLEMVRAAGGLASDEHVEIDDTGWDSRVYVVGGGEVVFKFARSDEVDYDSEIAALQLLGRHDLPVLVPRVRHVSDDGRHFSYSGIVGDGLESQLDRLSESDRVEAGSAIGAFLAILHQEALSNVPRWELEDEIGLYFDKYGMAAPVLDEAFRTNDRRRVHEFCTEQLPADLRRLGSTPVLAHGDLGPWNVVRTPDGEIGVIDFGDVGYHDASKDFSGLGDRLMTEAALRAYGGDEVLREKADLRARALPFLDIPFFMGKRDRDGIERCIAAVSVGILGEAHTPSARGPRHPG